MKNGNTAKIYVAMSGGVDSSVAAALLKKKGHEVTGVFFKPWSPDAKAAFCNWREDRQDAMAVAAKLGIKFKTWDFSKEYGRQVVKYMVDSYRAGITPNPDVMCNKEIKFGLFLKKALTEGADYIATGHYARLRWEIPNTPPAPRLRRAGKYQIPNKSKIQNPKSQKSLTVPYSLLTGLDHNKDQSYFLWTLTQEQLKHCIFPIGDHAKPEVRKMAKKFGLPNHDKKDSQGVCFVGQLDMKQFLKKYIKPKRGEIRSFASHDDRHGMRIGSKNSSKEKEGEIVGYHDGAAYYTIGQRHGLDIKDGHGPYFVAAKDIKKNIIYVARGENSKQLTASDGKISGINWINGEPKLPLDCQIKIRYRTKSVPAVIIKNGRGKTLLVKFKKPVRALTPGQSAVIYRGEVMLGGGIII